MAENVAADLQLRDVAVVTLLVGIEKALFNVHEELLFNASPVFKAALSGRFSEANTRSMELPDDDVDTVERMVQWIYTKHLSLTAVTSDVTSSECYWQLAHLNTLADKYDITALKNAIIDKMFELYLSLKRNPNVGKPPQPLLIQYIYSNTTETSAFRKALVAWYDCGGVNMDWYKRPAARRLLIELPEFATDLAIAFALKLAFNEKNPFLSSSSDLHEKPTEKVNKDKAT
ncbi:hypothetical protein P7C71_g4377, partial [Lecanoromycetidae sp. Uapishka_2]